MVLSIIILVLLGLIAAFHYVQGLFAATISAVCAGLAALMAFSYHESVVAQYAAQNLGSYGNPLALVVIFAVVFLALRFFADNLLVGNVRFPVILDRVGAPIMGLVAGFFAIAVALLAGQQLPFGPTLAWYAPYATDDQSYQVERRLSGLYRIPIGDDAINSDELTIARFGTDEAEESRQSFWLPVDEWFLGLVGKLSGTGSLAGPADFKQIYPDYKTAIFARRLGLQRSVLQVAYNLGEQKQVTVPAAFRLTTGGEGTPFEKGVPQVKGDLGQDRSAEEFLSPRAGRELIVVRINFGPRAGDQGDYVRFSPGTARLVAGGQQYFPIGTLETGLIAVQNKPDDYLLAKSGADLIYEVDPGTAINNGKLVDGAFFDFKHFARVDLSGLALGDAGVTKDATTFVLRKQLVREWIGARLLKAGLAGDIEDAERAFAALRESWLDDGETPPEATQPAGDGTTDLPEGSQRPMDVIRGESERRNEEIGGSGGGSTGGSDAAGGGGL